MPLVRPSVSQCLSSRHARAVRMSQAGKRKEQSKGKKRGATRTAHQTSLPTNSISTSSRSPPPV